MLFWHVVCGVFVARFDGICEAELGVNGAFAFVPTFDGHAPSSGWCWLLIGGEESESEEGYLSEEVERILIG